MSARATPRTTARVMPLDMAIEILEVPPPRPLIFRGANLEAQTITEHEWLLEGPADTGKTYACLARLDAEARRTPDGQGAMVRKVRADFKTTFRKRWDTTIGRLGGVTVHGGNQPAEYVYSNGFRLYVLGLDRDTAVLSGEFDIFYVNQAEELDAADWEMLSSRCTGRGAVTQTPMLFGDANPGTPGDWIETRSRDGGPLRVLQSRHVDNPELFDEVRQPNGAVRYEPTPAYETRMAPLRNFTGVRRARYFEGRRARAEGAVYEFDKSIHVVPRRPLPRSWRAFWVIDFGFTNPLCAQLWRLDDDDRAVMTNEVYFTQRLVEDHADDLARITAGAPREEWERLDRGKKIGDPDAREKQSRFRAGLRIEAWICDHDAEGRATLEKHLGITTTAAKKTIEEPEGIQLFAARLRPAGDGKPRAVFMDGALDECDPKLADAHKPTRTVEEFESFVYPKGTDGKPVKEYPVKKHNHGMDAGRYLFTHLDGSAGGDAWKTLSRQAEQEAEQRERAASAA